MDMFGIGAGIQATGALVGGALNAYYAGKAADVEYGRQKEFAQNSIQWRVNDAKKAGLHPLYALGGHGATYSPQAALGDDYGISEASRYVGEGLARSAEAKQAKKLAQFSQELQLKQLSLENKRLASDVKKNDAETLRTLKETQVLDKKYGGGVGFGSGSNSIVSDTLSTSVPGQAVNGSSVAASSPQALLTSPDKEFKESTSSFGFDKVASSLQYERLPNGVVAIRPSKENTEDDLAKTIEALYHGNNKYMENDFIRNATAAHPPPPGKEYELRTGDFGLELHLVPKGTRRPVDKNFIDWLVHSRKWKDFKFRMLDPWWYATH